MSWRVVESDESVIGHPIYLRHEYREGIAVSGGSASARG